MVTSTEIGTLLQEFIGNVRTLEQNDMMYFFAFYLFFFIVACIYDLITNVTK